MVLVNFPEIAAKSIFAVFQELHTHSHKGHTSTQEPLPVSCRQEPALRRGRARLSWMRISIQFSKIL